MVSRETVEKTYVGDDGVRWESVTTTIVAAVVLWWSEIVTTLIETLVSLPSTLPRLFWSGTADVAETVIGFAGSSWSAAWVEALGSLPALGPLSFTGATVVVAGSLWVTIRVLERIQEVASLE